jgi:uncharacterized protein YbcI
VESGRTNAYAYLRLPVKYRYQSTATTKRLRRTVPHDALKNKMARKRLKEVASSLIKTASSTPTSMDTSPPTASDVNNEQWLRPKKTARIAVETPISPVPQQNRFEKLPRVNDSGKSTRVPPIIMAAKLSHAAMIEEIKKHVKEFSLKYIGNGNVSIQCKNSDDFKILRMGLNGDTTNEYHTFTRKEDKKVKSVIRGLPNVAVEDIKQDLSVQGFPVDKVIKMTTKTPSNSGCQLYLVFFDASVNVKKIKEIRYICFTKITVVKYTSRNTNVTQCYRCQDFGHAAGNCHRKPKCVKCTGDHSTAECPKTDRLSPATCVGCSGSHPANYRECPKRQNYLKSLEDKKSRAPAGNPWKIPPVQKPHSTPTFTPVEKDFPNLPKTTPKTTQAVPNTPIQPKADLMSIASIQKIIKILQEIRIRASGCSDKLELAFMLVEYLDDFE